MHTHTHTLHALCAASFVLWLLCFCVVVGGGGGGDVFVCIYIIMCVCFVTNCGFFLLIFADPQPAKYQKLLEPRTEYQNPGQNPDACLSLAFSH